jgi:hypothetical protein
MLLEFICLLATALQKHHHTYVATGKAVQALLFNTINPSGKLAFK